MTVLRRGYVDTMWGQMHYRENGAMKSASALSCIAFHESPLSGEIFEGLGVALEGKMHFIAPDTPGYGCSDGPPSMITIEEYAGVMWAGLRPISSERKPWILGSHTGALIAVEIARRWGDEISGLVLSGTPVFRPERRWRYAGGHTPDLTPQHDGRHLLTAWERYRKKAEEGTSPESLRFMTYAACTIASNHDRYANGYQAAFRYDTLTALAEVSCPVLLLTATRDSCAAYDADLVAVRPDATVLQIPEVSGRPYWVAPDLFAADMLALIRSVEAE